MSQINPFVSSILQTPQMQRQQAAQRDREVRRRTERLKNSALDEDQVEHQVESSEELTPISEQPKDDRQFKKPSKGKNEKSDEGDDDSSHLDLTA